jgi:hypothetical protein
VKKLYLPVNPALQLPPSEHLRVIRCRGSFGCAAKTEEDEELSHVVCNGRARICRSSSILLNAFVATRCPGVGVLSNERV